jgi:hypothetical protein
VKHRQKLGAGIDGQPEHLCGAAQPGAQFIQLERREPEVAQGALVESLCMSGCTSEPRRDGGLTGAEDP